MRKSAIILFSLLCLAACAGHPEASVPCSVKDGVIVLETPARAAGQTSALQLACDPIDTVRVGFIGLGMRGSEAIRRYTYVEGARIAALCDIEPDRVSKALDFLAGKSEQKAMGVEEGDGGAASAAASGSFRAPLRFDGEDGWKALCESDEVDLVYICTDWLMHTPIAVYAMEHGKHVAVEVPAAMSIKECWELVDACERTRRHCMMLENCVYDFYELTALNMAQQGVFGEVYHVEGAYIHNLDPYWDKYHGNWRLDYDAKHRGDNYPTHGIGPVCQVLDIHRGDKMDFLVSQDTRPVHGAAVAKEKMGLDSFADGDHTVTLIRTHAGHQIEIQHNVYAARPYSRMYSLTGSEGFASKYPVKGFAVDASKLPAKEIYGKLDAEHFQTGEAYRELCKDFRHPLTEIYEQKAKEVGGHGGMDFIMDSRLIYCLRNGLPLDEDVYDAAEWSCLTELSRISIEAGSAPVAVPDFTRGDWDKVKGFKHAMK